VFQLIQDINGRNVTILLVEQNVKQILKMSDRTIVLESGKIIKSGYSKDLIEDDYVKEAYSGA